ncbi:hypothetical protein F441_19869 [Phytophthora nicotianae CJ01A1]|uniref:Uncharacterized protein n=1 Tax=Phytophthora nicotianae CJ01A1 TaxID=1317063 RepID=W2VXU8_PHYNI|nr:hypothetical protein F441_19869 [Phytophthora nicotianae CJ01A1]
MNGTGWGRPRNSGSTSIISKAAYKGDLDLIQRISKLHHRKKKKEDWMERWGSREASGTFQPSGISDRFPFLAASVMTSDGIPKPGKWSKNH